MIKNKNKILKMVLYIKILKKKRGLIMKELKLYLCEHCGTQYKNKTEAKKCEDSHKTKLKIKGMKFVSYKNNHTGFPIVLEVVDEKNYPVRYRRIS